jgi:hypothetical protein
VGRAAEEEVSTTDPRAFQLATFLVIAARELVDDPANYGPFRLIDAVDRFVAGTFDDDFLREVQPELERGFELLMADADTVASWLDELAVRFATEAKRRNLGE